MKIALTPFLLLAVLAGCAKPAPEAALPVADARRGELLYDTACLACHTTQAHWRDRRIVQSWPDLLGQVTRWQQVAGQNWAGEEIRDVAAYLNRRFYKLPAPEGG